MMDLKEIIKWFIPCFHILLVILKAKELRLTFIFLFLLFNFRAGCAANVNSDVEIVRNQTKYVDSLGYDNLKGNQSDVRRIETQPKVFPVSSDGSVGRTFGRPFKKIIAGLLPIVFQIGAASTWAVVAALVGVKTLIVTLVILKILLIAGAAKILADTSKGVIIANPRPIKPAWYKNPVWYKMYDVKNGGPQPKINSNDSNNTSTEGSQWVRMEKVGALFASKGHGHHNAGWEPPHPQKEIHLHIHNGHATGPEEHPPVYGPWSREDATNVVDLKDNPVDPYSMVGPPTIRTPYGNYVKLNDPLSNPKIKRK